MKHIIRFLLPLFFLVVVFITNEFLLAKIVAQVKIDEQFNSNLKVEGESSWQLNYQKWPLKAYFDFEQERNGSFWESNRQKLQAINYGVGFGEGVSGLGLVFNGSSYQRLEIESWQENINLVANSSFEDGVDSADFWTYNVGTGGSFEWSNENFLGDKSFKLDGSNSNNNSFQSNLFVVEPNSYYKISFYIKKSEGASGDSIAVDFANTRFKNETLSLSLINTNWQKKELYTKIFDLEETFVEVERYLIDGSVWIDNFKVEKIVPDLADNNNLKLSFGEKIINNNYSFIMNANHNAYNDFVSFNGIYDGADNHYNLDGNNKELVVKVNSQDIKRLTGKINLQIQDTYSGSPKNLEVSLDQSNWTSIYQIESGGWHNDISIPEDFFSLQNQPLYLRIKNAETGGSFRLLELFYQATLEKNYSPMFGYEKVNDLSLTDEKTIALWVKPNQTNSGTLVSCSNGNVNGEYRLYLEDNEVKLVVWDFAKVATTISTSIVANSWTHLAFSYKSNSGELKLYKNGQLVSSTITDGGLWTTVNTTQIGASEGGDNFSGSLDELYFFESVLSAEQVLLLYQKQADLLTKPKTMAYFSMNECGGSQIYDVNCQANTASINLGSAGQIDLGYCYQADTVWYQGRNGRFDAGLVFDGFDDYLDFGQNFNIGNLNQTISFYFKTSQSKGTLLSKNNKNQDELGGLSVYYQDDNLKVSFFTDTLKIINSNLSLADNLWHQVVLKIDRDEKLLDFYLDKVKVGSIDITSTVDDQIWVNSCSLIMAGRSDDDCNLVNDDFFMGQLDELNIFDFALDEVNIVNQFEFNYSSLGRNTISRQLFDFDFNSKNKLALFLASDVLIDQDFTLTIGDNAFVNQEIDNDTILYLDFDQDDSDYFFDKTGRNLIGKRFPYSLLADQVINSGLNNFNSSLAIDNDLTTKAFDSSGLSKGAFLVFLAKDKVLIDQVSLYLDDKDDESNYRIEVSLDGVNWNYLGFLKTKNFGWNNVILDNNDYYLYYRLVLNNSPTISHNVMEIKFDQSFKKVVGKFGKGVEFNGYSNCLELANKGLFQLPVYTYTAWIKPHNIVIGKNMSIFSNLSQSVENQDYNGTFFSIANDNNKDKALQISNTTGSDLNSINLAYLNSTVVEDEWQMVAITFDGSQAKLFHNGLKIAQKNLPTPVFQNSFLKASIGCNYSLKSSDLGFFDNKISFFNGTMDEIRIDEVARSEEEIKALFEVENRRNKIDYQAIFSLNEVSLKGATQELSLAITDLNFSHNLNDKLTVGDVIILKEEKDDQEYFIQGVVKEINDQSLSVKNWQIAKNGVPNWGGEICDGLDYCFSTNALVFAWRRELIDFLINQDTQFNILTFHFNQRQSQTVYLDDLRKLDNQIGVCEDCLLNPEFEVRSSQNQYFQYQAFLFTQNPLVSPEFNKVTLTYDAYPSPSKIMRHGKYFDNYGHLQPFWFAK